jgi:predicted kinase
LSDHCPVSTLFLLVGLPGAGKTERAVDLAERQRALRLTPDEWMVALFGEPEAGGKRDVLEGRLIRLALDALACGVDVVLDFGLWSRNERSALRSLAYSVGSDAELVYLPVDPEMQFDRTQRRWQRTPESTFAMTPADLEHYGQHFEAPTPDELSGAEVDKAPSGGTWREWASERWPSLQRT